LRFTFEAQNLQIFKSQNLSALADFQIETLKLLNIETLKRGTRNGEYPVIPFYFYLIFNKNVISNKQIVTKLEIV